MGYYTNYTMNVKRVDGKDMTEEQIEAITAWLRRRDLLHYSLSEPYFNPKDTACVNWPSSDNVKWYECDEDMRELSAGFPDMVFQLHGDGEENGDLWYSYYQDGRQEDCIAQVIYPEPQEIKW